MSVTQTWGRVIKYRKVQPGILLIFLVLGLALNWIQFPFVLGHTLYFGPAFSILLAKFLRPPKIFLATAIMASPFLVHGEYFLYGALIGEALLMSHLLSHQVRSVLSINLIYWLGIILPLAYFVCPLIEVASPYKNGSFLFEAGMDMVNVVCYSTLASLFIHSRRLNLFMTGIDAEAFKSIRQMAAFHIGLTLTAVLIAFQLFQLKKNANELLNTTSNTFSLTHEISHTNVLQSMDLFTRIFVEKRDLFSEIIDQPSKTENQLKQLHQRMPQFVSMLITNQEGKITHFSLSESIDSTGQDPDDIYVNERAYFKQAMMLPDQVYVSSGFRGKGFGSDMIAAISIAIKDSATQIPIGILEGSLKINPFSSILSALKPHHDMEYVLIDQQNQIILNQGDLPLQKLDTFEATQSTTQLNHLRFFTIQSHPALYMMESKAFPWGWRLVSLYKKQPIMDQLGQLVLMALSLLILSPILAQGMGYMLSRLAVRRLQWMIGKIQDDRLSINKQKKLARAMPSEITPLYQAVIQNRSDIIHLNDNLKQEVAEQTATIKQANAKLLKLSLTDDLTQLANRRSFLKHFNDTLNQCKNKQSALTLLLVDIDHFKQVNDQYGHAKGDELLLHLAQLMLSLTHADGHHVARIGGEEFAITVPGIELAAVCELAKALCRTAAQHPLVKNNETIEFTVSVGLYCCDPAQGGLPEYYKKADLALYHAKNNGRNQWQAHNHM